MTETQRTTHIATDAIESGFNSVKRSVLGVRIAALGITTLAGTVERKAVV